MGTKGPHPKEVRERAVKMVYDHVDEYPSKWAAICSSAEKLPMTAETLRTWVAQAEIDHGEVRGLTTDEKIRLRAPGRPTDPMGAQPTSVPMTTASGF
ncbi:MAG: hypothetical protein DCC49_13560 [Acidobacteria bacterium]|nr:MAG: hypothetical protein DCC49_13560 [Acidobacteriota bacterium]